eukprot:290992-Prymnesium_polylepis.1
MPRLARRRPRSAAAVRPARTSSGSGTQYSLSTRCPCCAGRQRNRGRPPSPTRRGRRPATQ